MIANSCLGYGWVPKCYWDVYDAVLTPGDLMTVRKRTRCLLVALSGHWFGRRACPLLGVKQTSLVRDRVSVNHPRV